MEEEKVLEVEEEVKLSKKDFDTRLKNKFIEGQEKAKKDFLEKNGIESIDDLKKFKEENELTKKEFETLKEQFNTSNQELSKLKAERVALKYVKNIDDAEDLVALVRGKGLELTEENLKVVAEKRFQGTTVKQIGTEEKNQTKTKPIPRVF
jgi:hypothetical protein